MNGEQRFWTVVMLCITAVVLALIGLAIISVRSYNTRMQTAIEKGYVIDRTVTTSYGKANND